MLTFDTLPVILVSAINENVATALMTELIENDVTDDYLKDTQSLDRVWRLVNKYYTADVRVHPLSDHGQLKVDPNTVEAHVIHLTEDEVADEGAMLARAAARAAAGRGRRVGVRLLLPECAEAGALGAWAAGRRCAALPRREPGALGAARQALHAHRWPGLRRRDRPAPPETVPSGSDSESIGDSDSEAEELRAVEQAEAFAAALGALGPALADRPGLLAGPGPLAGPRAESADRRERAEVLVHAFCRALGVDLDIC